MGKRNQETKGNKVKGNEQKKETKRSRIRNFSGRGGQYLKGMEEYQDSALGEKIKQLNFVLWLKLNE